MFNVSASKGNGAQTNVKYRFLGNISAGAHGLVLKAYHESNRFRQPKSGPDPTIDDRKCLAIKRIFVPKQKAEHLQLIREIKSLQLLRDEQFVS
jgi:serine/threonine protein kinase